MEAFVPGPTGGFCLPMEGEGGEGLPVLFCIYTIGFDAYEFCWASCPYPVSTHPAIYIL